MNQRVFVEMPIFERELQRLGRHRHPQPVLVCHLQMMELRRIAASDLLPLGKEPAALQAFSDLYATDTLIRRCRKTSGAAFRLSDLDYPAASTPLDFITSIRAETDHPYFPLIGLSRPEMPIMLSSAPPGPGADQALRWLEKIVSVDEEIFVPTLAPTLAVSLNQEPGQLIAAFSGPQFPSPAIHTPTLHFPYGTSEGVIKALAAELGVQCGFRQPPAIHDELAASVNDQWITKTLADFHHYVCRKGVSEWPSHLPFDVLTQARQSSLYAVHFSPLGWMGSFLDLPGGRFGHLASYVDGLQSLLFARYRVMGEEPPSTPADALTDFKL